MGLLDRRHSRGLSGRIAAARAAYDKMTAATALTAREHAETFAFEVQKALEEIDRRIRNIEDHLS